MSTSHDATLYLGQLGQGDESAAERLMPIVYHELKSLADSYFRGQPSDHTLQPTALVNEAFMRLIDQTGMQWKDRRHFLAVAATAMRQILTDHARRVQADKRGGGWRQVGLEGVHVDGADDQQVLDVLALDDALQKLAQLDPRRHRIVELRFFAGLTMEQIAEELGVSLATVELDWRATRAWLSVE